ncbi:MAG: aldehyde dehydrogenase family protein [Rickettsiales bacterium]
MRHSTTSPEKLGWVVYNYLILRKFGQNIGGKVENEKLVVTSPCDGEKIAELEADNGKTLAYKIKQAISAQKEWAGESRGNREKFLLTLSSAITEKRQELIDIIVYDAGKTAKEAAAEIDGAASILKKTIDDSKLADLNGMIRIKERPPVGIAGLITSFNFPLAVAYWTIAPALLAGNAVIWKPSEKTPMIAAAVKEIFDKVMKEYSDLLNIIIGGRDIGQRLVAHEQIDMISATGSVAMGQGIKNTLAQKENNNIPPILELGGNNGVIISNKMSDEHLSWSINAITLSFLATSGQRCTNTRRLIVHKDICEKTISLLKQKITDFLSTNEIISPVTGESNKYGYSCLIDEESFLNFEKSKKQAILEGGEIFAGGRLLKEKYPSAYYVEPSLAIMSKQSAIMHKETFAPLIFIVSYDDFSEAVELLNEPENAGLVNGFYTQSQQEAEIFAHSNKAGHTLINSPKGTGTPAFGMGFGGNRLSGEGEILNSSDPLHPFTKRTSFNRIAINSEIKMDK